MVDEGKSWMELERRIGPRLSTSVPVVLQYPEGELKEGWGRILNVSATGLLIETRFRVKMAGVLYVSFAIQGGIHFENLRARVVRASFDEGYYVLGVAFDEVVDQQTMRDVIVALAYEGGVTSSREIKNY